MFAAGHSAIRANPSWCVAMRYYRTRTPSPKIPSMSEYLSSERPRTPVESMAAASEGVGSLIGRRPLSSAELKREAVESRVNVLVSEIDSLRASLRRANEESAALKGGLQKALVEGKKAAEDAEKQMKKMEEQLAEVRAEMKEKSVGRSGFDELPDPESEELVAWRLRSQDLEQELDDIKRDYQLMEKEWADKLIDEQGSRALPIVMVAACVALTVGAGSVYAVNHYHHKDRLKMCERQLEFENRIGALDQAYTETLMKLSSTEKALASANAQLSRYLTDG
ncbi:hypothetical protein FOL47_007187 [Perkinsus chesapeaki]|uniref:Uncharacterized protein n=1 Tax=Perkinsus chesapeaki TaxID=330153 RepID=A0A7J6LM78_PERCH|nr:hypothetical protein FOL47_007187 [Perkinsus chesapeaki]